MSFGKIGIQPSLMISQSSGGVTLYSPSAQIHLPSQSAVVPEPPARTAEQLQKLIDGCHLRRHPLAMETADQSREAAYGILASMTGSLSGGLAYDMALQATAAMSPEQSIVFSLSAMLPAIFVGTGVVSVLESQDNATQAVQTDGAWFAAAASMAAVSAVGISQNLSYMMPGVGFENGLIAGVLATTLFLMTQILIRRYPTTVPQLLALQEEKVLRWEQRLAEAIQNFQWDDVVTFIMRAQEGALEKIDELWQARREDIGIYYYNGIQTQESEGHFGGRSGAKARKDISRFLDVVAYRLEQGHATPSGARVAFVKTLSFFVDLFGEALNRFDDLYDLTEQLLDSSPTVEEQMELESLSEAFAQKSLSSDEFDYEGLEALSRLQRASVRSRNSVFSG